MNEERIYPAMVIRSQAETIELLEKENEQLQQELTDYKERNEKAIEYIKDNVAVYAFGNKELPHWEFNDDEIEELIEILDKKEGK